jgi:hypothetical protein
LLGKEEETKRSERRRRFALIHTSMSEKRYRID